MKNENIEEILENIGSEGVPADVHKIAQEAFGDFTKTLPKPRHSILREYIMNRKITKLAAAAAIIIAVFAGLHFVGNPFGATVTFADVVEPILNAKSIILDIIISSDESGPVMHEIVVGSRIRRTMSNMPNLVQIVDLDNGKMLALDTESKTAVYIDIKGQLQDATRNYVKFLRQVIRQVKNGQVEKVGEKVIDGQKAIGFVGRGQNEEVTIWADHKTGHPLRIELQVGQMSSIMKNFKFDVPIGDAEISMDPPPGYTLQKTNIDLGNATEQDFIEGLRIWAKILGDGVFPETIGMKETVKQMPALIEKLKALNIPAEEGTDMGMKVGLGMMFHQMLDTGGNDYAYTGAGVKLGDADKAIFWYLPTDSQTYRVIYGDLSVKDIAPEDLPK
jgi:outer membrane lipoprotein-sorting protein